MAFDINTHREVTRVTTYEDTALGIMRWGLANAFPQTLKNLIEQSPTAKPAVARTAKFYKGMGFEGSQVIVNPNGATLARVVDKMADDLAYFNAFALHMNYNIKGEVSSITPMSIPDLRFNSFDELNFASKIGYHENFGGNSEVQKTKATTVTREKIKWIDKYNPSAVLSQIEKTKGGLSNYNGQILYYSGTGHSNYPVPPLQPVINYVLADIENSILVLEESTTGFINSYILKTTMSSDDPVLEALEKSIAAAQGARGNGKVITMTDLTPEDIQATLLEEIGGGGGSHGNIIEACTSTYDLCQRVISGIYLIPSILAGSDQKTGFSAPDLEDGYFVFNSHTEEGRMLIAETLNGIIEHSIFSEAVPKIIINPLRLNVKKDY